MKLHEIKVAEVSKPIRVTAFHGTNVDIEKFTGVVYFSTQQDAAEGYARGKVNINKGGSARIYEVELTFENPWQFQTMQQIGTLTKDDIAYFKKKGYDGGFYDGKTSKEPVPEYVPFSPETVEIKRVIRIK